MRVGAAPTPYMDQKDKEVTTYVSKKSYTTLGPRFKSRNEMLITRRIMQVMRRFLAASPRNREIFLSSLSKRDLEQSEHLFF